MSEHLFEPLGRPIVVIFFGSLLGLLAALGRGLFPLGPTSNPLYFGLTCAVGFILILSIVTIAYDTLVWFSSSEEPSDSPQD